jgi:hypothetical protein
MQPIDSDVKPPAQLQISRDLEPGQYPLLRVFRGLEKIPVFRAYPATPKELRKLAQESSVQIVKERGEWMYVAPRELPADADARWKPFLSTEDCVVVGQDHLAHSPAIVLYLDILHELFHVIQRKAGRELWDPKYTYVDRPTELEAYRFAVQEGRRLKASESFLREYLRVEWVSDKEYRRLLRHVGVRVG